MEYEPPSLKIGSTLAVASLTQLAFPSFRLSWVSFIHKMRSSWGESCVELLSKLSPLHTVDYERILGAFRTRPEFWVHRLRTTKTINRTTTIVPAKP
jgi:hypothetical protein